MPSIAANTLAKAHFFIDCAEETSSQDRNAFCHFLEAAIVFARSVTFHLQKEFRHRDDFKSWYTTWQNRLRADSLSSFLLEQRNYVLKQGSLGVSKHVSVELSATAFVESSVGVVVIRGQPWYQRPLRTLIDDATWPVRHWWHERKQRHERERRRRDLLSQQRNSVVQEDFYFAEEAWNHTPAVELVRKQLVLLREVVDDAERRYL